MEKGPRGGAKKDMVIYICASRYVCLCVCAGLCCCSRIYIQFRCVYANGSNNIVTRRTSPRIKSGHILRHTYHTICLVCCWMMLCTYYLDVVWTDKGNHFKMKKKKVHLFLISLYPHAEWYMISTDFEASGENIICYYCAPCCSLLLNKKRESFDGSITLIELFFSFILDIWV